MKFELNEKERKIFEKLNTPAKIQDFLDTVPFNFERNGETLYSPRELLIHRKAHCMEGALFAAAVLWYHGSEPLILDLKSMRSDFDHAVALFKQNGYWGCISKTNHSVLLYRDAIYKNIHELVMSFFHEYFLDNGKKTLLSYSKPFNLAKFGSKWVTEYDNLWYIDRALNKSPHIKLLSSNQRKSLRPADKIQITAGKIVKFKK